MASKRNIFWPGVSTLDDAKWATKQGIWAALFVACVTGIVSGAAVAMHKPILGVGGSGLIDAAIFAAVAYGIHRNSRFAAVTGLVIYLVERMYMFKAAGSNASGGTVMVVFLTLAFVTAIRGTFAHRKLSETQLRAPNIPEPIAR